MNDLSGGLCTVFEPHVRERVCLDLGWHFALFPSIAKRIQSYPSRSLPLTSFSVAGCLLVFLRVFSSPAHLPSEQNYMEVDGWTQLHGFGTPDSRVIHLLAAVFSTAFCRHHHFVGSPWLIAFSSSYHFLHSLDNEAPFL